MDRRRFLKTVGVSAGVAGVGAGATVGPLSDDGAQVVEANELPDAGVELLTDEYGVSHVYGEDRYTVGYGQGYAQARDRLFQLDLMRLIGRGESSTLVGAPQLSSDIEVKRDLYSEAELETQWENATGENRALIEGFADGVSDRMAEMKANGELPGEFTLLGRDPDPWEPLDTVAVIAYFIGFFGIDGGHELTNAKTVTTMFDRFDEEATAWAAYHDINRVKVPENHYGSLLESEAATTDESVLEYESVPDEQLDAIEAARDTEPWGVETSEFDGIQDVFRIALGMLEGTGFGSNALIVDGEHTETGQPMLAGGPQMSLLKPPVVHEIGLHGAGFEVTGVGVIGTPGVIVGRTPEFAWTGTSAREDMIDTIAVDLDPDDHTRYEWDGEFHEFVTEEYVHEPNLWAGLVNGQTSPERVEQAVAYVEQADTRMPVTAVNHEEDVAFVKRLPTRMEELDAALDWLNVGRANSREEFEAALEDFPFGYNFHYAGEDDIGFYRTGALIERDDGGDPRFPMPEGHHEWADVRTGEAVGAWQANPERGYVVNWNNSPATGWRNADGEFEWSGAHRIDVIDHLVRQRIVETDDSFSLGDVEGDPLPASVSGNLSLADVEGIIEDCSVQQPFAPQVVPHIVAAGRASDEEPLQAMADELEAWAEASGVDRWTDPDFERWAETTYSFRATEEGRYQNGGLAIYEAVREELNGLLFADTLGPEAPSIEFDPTAGDPLSGSVDPHAADHGTASTTTSLLVNALEGRAAFDWLGDHSNEFQLVNAATGKAMELDRAGSLWGWLFDEDEIRQAAPTDRDIQRWRLRDATEVTFERNSPRELSSWDDDRAATLDGVGRGAELTPTDGTDSGQFAFEPLADGTYRIRNADSGLVVEAAETGSIRQDSWTGRDAQRWRVEFTQSTDARRDVLQSALRGAAERLESTFDSGDPSEWRLENRVSEFAPLGGASTNTIPMTNRASYQQAISLHAPAETAQSLLPPGNSGHMDTWELVATQLGNEPGRLTDQLQKYVDFEYKPQPLARDRVEEQATESTQVE